MLVIVIKSG